MRYLSFRTLGQIVGAAGLLAAVIAPAPAQTFVPLPQSLIVFPFDKPEGTDQSVADTVTSGVRARMDRVAGYDSTTFNPRSPLIRRATQAGELTQTQVAGPFDAASGAAVALAAGVDNALVGSVESATISEGAAKVSVSVQLVSARDAQVQKTAGVTGSASQAGLAPDALLRLAADDAAAKAVAQVFGSSTNAAGGGAAATTPANGTTTTPENGAAVTPAPNGQPGANATGSQITIPTSPAGLPSGGIPVEGGKRKSGNSSLIIGGVLLLGIILAASGGGGGGNGGGNNGGGGPPGWPF